MGIVLRDYQREAVAAVQAAWDEGINRPAVVMATGAGKTTVFSDLIGRNVERLRKEGKRILVIAHRGELLDQAEARIKLQNPGVWTAVVKGGRGATTHQFADVVIASMQTLARKRRREAIDRIGMIIVDECHNAASSSYLEVLDHYGARDERAVPTVGFTATLTRMNGGLPEIWQSVAYSMKIHQLIKMGFLVPPVAKSIEVPGLNLATTRITAGDLNTKDLAGALDDAHAFSVIAGTWKSEAATPGGMYDYRPTIAFMPNVDTCHKLADAFAAIGVTADVVVGSTPPTERKRSFERFRAGECNVLVGAMVLTEGFDAPHTSCVIIGRPTLNVGLYIQCVGRGLRLHPESGKEDCLILDVAGASLKHNLAGANDLESECGARGCDCNCLRCGCNENRCLCGLRQCGCRCVEQHESSATGCRCAGTEECGCGCPGDTDGTGMDACACDINPDCGCCGGGEAREKKEVGEDVLKTLTVVDVLGSELAKSRYTWLKTNGGVDFLTVGQEQHLFLLPARDGTGFHLGHVTGTPRRPVVTRLDDGAQEAAVVRQAAEDYADRSGFTYNNRKASWRRTPASEGQLKMLGGLGVVPPDGCRKGQASDLLSVAKASRLIDPTLRGWGYVK